MCFMAILRQCVDSRMHFMVIFAINNCLDLQRILNDTSSLSVVMNAKACGSGAAAEQDQDHCVMQHAV